MHDPLRGGGSRKSEAPAPQIKAKNAPQGQDAMAKGQ
jgi:hypothetical protein